MEENYLKLATAIIEQVVRDLNDPITVEEDEVSFLHPTKREQKEAMWFIKKSILFKKIAAALNIDEQKARQALLARVS